MKAKMRHRASIAVPILLLLGGLPLQAETHVKYLVVGCGGGHVTSTTHQIKATMGQTITARTASAVYRIYAGLWEMFRSDPFAAIPEGIPDFRNHLFLNAPNPSNPGTTIRFSVADEIKTRIAIYDVQGRNVATLIDETVPAGEHSLIFHPDYLPSGVYILRMNAGSFSSSRRVVLQK